MHYNVTEEHRMYYIVDKHGRKVRGRVYTYAFVAQLYCDTLNGVR